MWINGHPLESVFQLEKYQLLESLGCTMGHTAPGYIAVLIE